MTLEWRLLFSLLEHQEQRKRSRWYQLVGGAVCPTVRKGVGAAVGQGEGTGVGYAVGAG